MFDSLIINGIQHTQSGRNSQKIFSHIKDVVKNSSEIYLGEIYGEHTIFIHNKSDIIPKITYTNFIPFSIPDLSSNTSNYVISWIQRPAYFNEYGAFYSSSAYWVVVEPVIEKESWKANLYCGWFKMDDEQGWFKSSAKLYDFVLSEDGLHIDKNDSNNDIESNNSFLIDNFLSMINIALHAFTSFCVNVPVTYSKFMDCLVFSDEIDTNIFIPRKNFKNKRVKKCVITVRSLQDETLPEQYAEWYTSKSAYAVHSILTLGLPKKYII